MTEAERAAVLREALWAVDEIREDGELTDEEQCLSILETVQVALTRYRAGGHKQRRAE